MATLHIDRLLETCIKRGASDLHLHVGRPPTLRVHGRLRSLATKVLEPEATASLMKALTPRGASRNSRRLGARTSVLPLATPDGFASACSISGATSR